MFFLDNECLLFSKQMLWRTLLTRSFKICKSNLMKPETHTNRTNDFIIMSRRLIFGTIPVAHLSEICPLKLLNVKRQWTLLLITQNNYYRKTLLGNEWGEDDSIKEGEKRLPLK